MSHGPNFVIVPKEPPTSEYIVAIERACLKLPTGKAEELRGEIKTILKKKINNKPNITKEEHQAIKELRRDNTRMALTADKGVSMVVMDKEDYNTKSEELLQTSTYQVLSTDPTNRHKNKLISLLKSIKAEGGISETTYKKLYPTGATPPKYYGLPKVHKKDTPLRPIVSSIGSVTYETAKELSRILKPLVGRSTHHVRNNQDFIQSIEEVTVKSEKCMMSFDVKALFTSIPIQPTLNIIKKLLEEDTSLHQRTTMAVKHIYCLLEFCLTNTYFSFQGKLSEQKGGAAMGSPISPIVANISVEYEHGYFSFCLFKCRLVCFSQEQNQIFEIADKLLPVSNMASSRSEENVNLRQFPTQGDVTVLVSPAILLDYVIFCCCGRCLSHYCMAL